jgi:hypothetical protein
MDAWEPKIAREVGWIKRPSIFMPRWASRVTLEVTGVRVERVRDIDRAGILAEGIERLSPGNLFRLEREMFSALWNGINAKRGYGWNTNPLVWVITFKVV